MVAAVTASSFSPIQSSSATSKQSKPNGGGGGTDSLDARSMLAKPNSTARGIQVKASAQAVPKVNGTKVGFGGKKDEDVHSYAPRTFYNQLPDWSMLLAAVTTIFLAAEKQWTLIDWKPRRPDMLADAFGLGKIVQDGLIFKQNFSIRSYEIGADKTASIETLMNHLQETALNHVKSAGILGDGFGATPEMSIRNLLWVVGKMHVVVEQYPSWGDTIQVESWVTASGKNGMRRDWHVRDSRTNQTIMRATSLWVMMNKNTRKFSKMPEEVRAEIEPYFVERAVIVSEDSRKLPKLNDDTADYVKGGLTPRWSDLDVNQHVNNVKYIGWMLESAPMWILESHELVGMTMEYRKECGRDSVVQSLTAVSNDSTNGSQIECNHLLQLENGTEVMKGRTKWRPKRAHGLPNMGPIPAAST